jgi:hypothetical protein
VNEEQMYGTAKGVFRDVLGVQNGYGDECGNMDSDRSCCYLAMWSAR